MLSHDNITWVSRTYQYYLQSEFVYEVQYTTVLVSPVTNIAVSILQVFVPLLYILIYIRTGMVVFIIENELNIETIIDALLLVAPTFMVGFPNVYEGLYDLYKRYNMTLSPYAKKNYDKALTQGALAANNKEYNSDHQDVGCTFGCYKNILQKLSQQFGLQRYILIY